MKLVLPVNIGCLVIEQGETFESNLILYPKQTNLGDLAYIIKEYSFCQIEFQGMGSCLEKNPNNWYSSQLQNYFKINALL